MTARKIIIDTDPGIDDAVAILWALAAPEALEVLGIVAVAGNLPVAETERNARRVCELAGRRDVPVFAGCARPLLQSPVTAAQVHGETGLGELVLPEPSLPPQPRHGVDFLIETLREAEADSVTLCALGPLTDIAVALAKAPEIAGRVRELVVMGGARAELGNVTPTAEFNIYADPHAAAMVLTSGLPLVMVPLDATHKVLSTPARIERVRALGSGCARAVATLLAPPAGLPQRRYGIGPPLHDPCVIAYLLRPDLFEGRLVNVMVETTSPLTIGMTVVDWWGVTPRPPNARFIEGVDADRLYDLLCAHIARLP
ncbi:MAG TPA: nucleoside hydrolase [Stellaceae bacterium]|nr:nucleoside hydrolase [Stellaceae bacterium]